MQNYRLEIYFHAENEEDAENQAMKALDAFDDGFEEAYVKLMPNGRSLRLDPELGLIGS